MKFHSNEHIKMGSIVKLFQRKNCNHLSFRQFTENTNVIKTPGARKSRLIPKPLYGGRRLVTMIPGSNVGKMLMDILQKVFYFAGAPVNFEIINVNDDNDDGASLNTAITSITRNMVGIKGFIEADYNKTTTALSREMVLRNQLDLYVSVMKCKLRPLKTTRYKDLDLVIIRQNTEGEYSMLEHENVHGIVESLKIITKKNSERIARFAFKYAKKHKRKMVTIIHKADILTVTDGLFLSTCRQVSYDYPDIKVNDMLVDTCCMQLVQNPQQFDVLLMTNLYGTVITNAVIGISNGAGLLSSRNYGQHYALFEPALRFYDEASTDKRTLNPIVMLNAGVDMLHYLGLQKHADIIENAINKTLWEDCVLTSDLGGKCTSSQVVDNVLKCILRSTFVQN